MPRNSQRAKKSAAATAKPAAAPKQSEAAAQPVEGVDVDRPEEQPAVGGRRVFQVIPGRAILWPDGTLRGEGAGRRLKHRLPNGKRVYEECPPYAVLEGDPYAFPAYAHNLELAPAGVVPVPIDEWPTQYRSAVAELFGAVADGRDVEQVLQDAHLAENGAPVVEHEIPDTVDLDALDDLDGFDDEDKDED